MTRASDVERLWQPYTDAIEREIEAMLETIPAEDLLIQWDACAETLAIDPGAAWYWAWQPAGDLFERFGRSVATLSACVPDAVRLGIHLCYGAFRNQHLVEPQNLGHCVTLANTAAANAGRRLDYVHMPVPQNRDDDAYFAPLADLDIGRTKLYLGLLHGEDLEANLRRVEAARHYASHFGVATECGMGRVTAANAPALLEAHRAVADNL